MAKGYNASKKNLAPAPWMKLSQLKRKVSAEEARTARITTPTLLLDKGKAPEKTTIVEWFALPNPAWAEGLQEGSSSGKSRHPISVSKLIQKAFEHWAEG
jgi:hypothetical protein